MAVQRKDLKTFKHQGRKYIIVKSTANRQEHSTTAVKLVKRAGKAHWFVATVHNVGIKGRERTELVRYINFWDALAGYDSGCGDIGVILGSDQTEKVDELLALSPEEQAELIHNVGVRVNA